MFCFNTWFLFNLLSTTIDQICINLKVLTKLTTWFNINLILDHRLRICMVINTQRLSDYNMKFMVFDIWRLYLNFQLQTFRLFVPPKGGWHQPSPLTSLTHICVIAYSVAIRGLHWMHLRWILRCLGRSLYSQLCQDQQSPIMHSKLNFSSAHAAMTHSNLSSCNKQSAHSKKQVPPDSDFCCTYIQLLYQSG